MPIGKGILIIPDEREREIHGKKPIIQYGWAETENHYYARPYFVPLEDLKKVSEFSIGNVIMDRILDRYTHINNQTRARGTLTEGLIIEQVAPDEGAISSIEFSKEQYSLIKKYF